jgi:hypothetical protein
MEAHCKEWNSLEAEIIGALGSNIGSTNKRWMVKPDSNNIQRVFLTYESLRAREENICEQIHNYPDHIHMAFLPCETSSS